MARHVLNLGMREISRQKIEHMPLSLRCAVLESALEKAILEIRGWCEAEEEAVSNAEGVIPDGDDADARAESWKIYHELQNVLDVLAVHRPV